MTQKSISAALHKTLGVYYTSIAEALDTIGSMVWIEG